MSSAVRRNTVTWWRGLPRRLASPLRSRPKSAAGAADRPPAAAPLEMAVTFLIFIATFVTIACLGLPLAILAAFAALTREKSAPASSRGTSGARRAIEADRFTGRWV